MLRFRATEDQVMEMAANAVNASQPMGMGHMVANPRQKFEARDMGHFLNLNAGVAGLFIDYAQGRMVKLSIWKKEEDIWETDGHGRGVDLEYQSWGRKYKTYEELVKSVEGVEILNA